MKKKEKGEGRREREKEKENREEKKEKQSPRKFQSWALGWMGKWIYLMGSVEKMLETPDWDNF